MTRKASKERRKTITGGTVTEVSLAAELIERNVDLLTEILVRLPAKSLIRFKCVSKHWLSLISHSQFRSNHSIRNPRPPISGMYFYFHSELHSVSFGGHQELPSLSFLVGFPEKSRTTVLHSCNGLLLINNDHFDGHRHRELLIVCNPTTKEYKILPSSHISKSWTHGFAYLAFDPSKSPHYKVVYFNFFCSPYVIYCSQNACWKHLTTERIDCPGVFWNGAIHWFGGENSLLRFDVNAEEIIAMPNPQKPKILTRKKIKYLGESGGRLILIQSKKRFPLGFKILELDKDYCCWRIVKCQVNLRPLLAALPDIICPHRGFEVLHVAKGDKEKDFTLVLAIWGRIVSYDLKCKTWNVLLHLPGESHVFGADYAYPFIPFTETLFPV